MIYEHSFHLQLNRLVPLVQRSFSFHHRRAGIILVSVYRFVAAARPYTYGSAPGILITALSGKKIHGDGAYENSYNRRDATRAGESRETAPYARALVKIITNYLALLKM